MADVTEVEDLVFGRLAELSLDDLIEIHTEYEMQAIPEGKRVKSYVLKVILKYLSSEVVTDAEDEGLGTFMWIRDLINKKIDEQIDQQTVKIPEPKTEPVEIKSEDKSFEDEISRISGFSSKALKTVLKRDFKLKGSIGLPGQKDKLTFSSLAFQIEGAVKKGYSEDEIVEEVVRAITPDLQLRSFLEGKSELTLPKLRRILRAHFQEQDPTTLFNTLSNAVQTGSESALEFVIRLMNLRQKILFVSKEVDNRFQYSEMLLQNQFLHSVVTGLRNESVKNEIKPLLSASKLSDEELLESVNKAVSDEKMRQGKLKKNVNNVNMLSEVQNQDEQVEKSKKDKEKENPILKELRELKVQLNEVSTLKTEIESLKKQMTPSNSNKERRGGYRGRPKCEECRKNNVDRCEHCIRCGSGGHQIKDCPTPSN